MFPCMLMRLPAELQLMVMACLPNISSLHNLTRAHRSLAQIFDSFSAYILPNVLANSMPRDLQELVCTLISIQESAPFRDNELSFVLNGNVSFDKGKRLFQIVRRPKDSVKVLHKLSRTIKAIQSFTDLFPEVFACRHKDFKSRRLDNVETHRLQRGLWRFEICCALVQAWRPSKDRFSVQIGDDTRVPRLVQFLEQFLPWELEELMCVYEFLELAVLDYGKEWWNGRVIERLTAPSTTNWNYWRPEPRANRMVAANTGLFAPLGQFVPTKGAYRAATRSRLLAQGLVFLWAFQQQPVSIKIDTESRLEGCSFGDEFIWAAHYSCIPLDKALKQTRRSCSWEEKDDDNNRVEGAEGPNERWISFDTAPISRTYPSVEQLRYWAYCIWSKPADCCNPTDSPHITCMCHLCKDYWEGLYNGGYVSDPNLPFHG